MKLLFDQNLSPRLVQVIEDFFPGSTHVREVALQKADDDKVWSYAAANGYIIVSKDADFHQMSFVLGHPPKVIWIRRGNCSTSDVAQILRNHVDAIIDFELNEETAFLVIS